MSGVHRPAVAFGLRAMTIALKAKTRGAPLPSELIGFYAFWMETLPGDGRARAAVIRFIATVGRTPEAAGEDLLAFLSDWSGEGDHARRAEAILREADAAVEGVA